MSALWYCKIYPVATNENILNNESYLFMGEMSGLKYTKPRVKLLHEGKNRD
jgi:hypothetical protein